MSAHDVCDQMDVRHARLATGVVRGRAERVRLADLFHDAELLRGLGRELRTLRDNGKRERRRVRLQRGQHLLCRVRFATPSAVLARMEHGLAAFDGEARVDRGLRRRRRTVR